MGWGENYFKITMFKNFSNRETGIWKKWQCDINIKIRMRGV